MLPGFTTYEVRVIKTLRHGHRARETDQRDRMESRNSPVRMWSLDLWQRGLCRVEGKKLFLLIAAGQLVSIYKRSKFGPLLHTTHK